MGNDVVHSGNSTLWHVWLDSPGIPLAPSFIEKKTAYNEQGKRIFSYQDTDELVSGVTKNGLYLLVYDILDTWEFPFLNDLLGAKGVTPFLSKSGGISALAMRKGKQNGLLVSSQGWKFEGPPTPECTKNIASIFRATGYQASTPASLSEKLLRLTLSNDQKIYAPCKRLREDVLYAHSGARIDRPTQGIFVPFAYEIDKNKAYLHHTRRVPSPYLSPVFLHFPPLDEALSYPTGLWKCQMIYRELSGVRPIVFKEKLAEGEVFERWLWTEELRDCLEYGYPCKSIERGYGFREMSDFMVPWGEFLWQIYTLCEHEEEQIKDIFKSMMVGLPGRFLRKPGKLVLVHDSEKKEGDTPLKLHWHSKEDQVISDWLMRFEPQKKSSALVHIGSYIVMKMRQDLYHTMKGIECAGGRIISTYADSITATGGESYLQNLIGKGLGEWKMKRFQDVYAEENRVVAKVVDPYSFEYEIDLRAPGFCLDQRVALLKKYHHMRG